MISFTFASSKYSSTTAIVSFSWWITFVNVPSSRRFPVKERVRWRSTIHN